MKGKNLNWMPNLVRWLFSIFHSCSPSNLRHFIISFIILTLVIFAGYHIFDWIGYLDFFLRKLSGSFLLHGLRALFRIFGWQMPICVLVFIIHLGDSSLFMDAAGGGQPAADQPLQAPGTEPSTSSSWSGSEGQEQGETASRKREERPTDPREDIGPSSVRQRVDSANAAGAGENVGPSLQAPPTISMEETAMPDQPTQRSVSQEVALAGAKGAAQGIGEQLSKCLCKGVEAGCQYCVNLQSE